MSAIFNNCIFAAHCFLALSKLLFIFINYPFLPLNLFFRPPSLYLNAYFKFDNPVLLLNLTLTWCRYVCVSSPCDGCAIAAPLSVSCGTNVNQRLVTWLYSNDTAVSPVLASLLSINSWLHALRFVCIESDFRPCWMCVLSGAAVSVPVGGDRRGGGCLWGRSGFPLWAQTNVAMSWVVFVNTHWGLILCTLNLLRTWYVLSWALLLRYPPPPFHRFSLSRTVVKMLFLFLPYHAYTVVAGHLLLLLLLHSLLSTDWSAVTLCTMVLHSAWTVSLGLRPSGFSDTLFNALLQVRFQDPTSTNPKARTQIFNSWQMQIPKISLCPVFPLLSALQHVY